MYHIRLLNKRDRTATIPDDLIVFDIDRTCPIMGNPSPLEDKDDEYERQSVIEEYQIHFDKKYAERGALYDRVHYFSDLVKSGKKIALRCWCHPHACHGDVIISKINSITKILENDMLEMPTTVDNIPHPPVDITIKGPSLTKKVPDFLKQPFSDEEVDYRECRFAIHLAKTLGVHDWHMVKEVVHLKDGRSIPNIRYMKNYKRKFWVTSPRFRKSHNQKKEYEYLDNLIEGEATQKELYRAVALALGKNSLINKPHLVRDEPHVYGLDIPSTVSIKHDYTVAMKGRKDTPYKIAYSDTETNMLNWDKGAGKHIIMQSLFCDGKLYTVILKSFLATVPDPIKTLRELYEEHMPEEGKKEVSEWEVELVDEPIDIVKRILLRCHSWQPDFLSFWNMIFDLDKMIECVEQAGYRVEDIFCDPRLPKELRYAFLKRANPSKTSASGRLMTKKPFDMWHSFLCPASFYIVDQMSTYRFVRKSKQLEPSYALDAILKKELGEKLGKLKHAPAEGLTKGEFHIFMQQKYPGEYVIYHLWDAVCMHLLTKKTKDLDFSLPGTTEFSDFVTFESEPKRYIHKFHYYALENHGAVTGVSGPSLVQEYDSMTISTKGHIITLEPHLTVDTGMKVFRDYPGLRSNMYGHNADLDVKSSYPYGQWAFNMSRRTTVRELINIAGVREHVKRIQGLNLSGGRSNAIEFCTEIFGLPTMANLSKIYDQAHA